mgnify:CR=1 FL=1
MAILVPEKRIDPTELRTNRTFTPQRTQQILWHSGSVQDFNMREVPDSKLGGAVSDFISDISTKKERIRTYIGY